MVATPLRYHLAEVLGAGASGAVYRARDRREDRWVALKVAAPETREQVVAEFEALATIRHPRVVRALDLEVLTRPEGPHPPGSVYASFELVDGRPLDQAMAACAADGRNRLAAAMLDQLAEALAAVHAAGLVHADIKPANILVGDDALVLVDFGLSLVPQPVRGTLPFMAPEVLAGEVTAWADLYAGGASMWAACAKRPPFCGDTTESLIRRICSESPAPLGDVATWVDPRIARLVAAMLDRDAERRPTPMAIREALEPVLRDHGIEPGALSAPRVARFTGRRAELDATAAALAQLDAGPGGAVVVSGAPGSGRSTVCDLARRRHQLALAAGRVRHPLRVADVDALVAGGGDTPTEALVRGMSAVDPDAIWMIDRPDDPRVVALLAQLAAGEPDDALPRMLITAEAPASAGLRRIVELGPLSAQDGTSIVRDLDPDIEPEPAAALVAAAAGRPGPLIASVRTRESGEYRELIGAELERVGELPSDVAGLLAHARGSLTRAQLGIATGAPGPALVRALAALATLGWVHPDPPDQRQRWRLSSETLADTLRRHRDRNAACRRLAAALPDHGAEGWRQVFCRVLGGESTAEDAILAVARCLTDDGRAELALELLDGADGSAALRLRAAELAIRTGDYPGALERLEGAASAPGGDELAVEIALSRADALARSGRRDRALEVCQQALGARPAPALRARIARLHVDLGDYRAALAAAPDPSTAAEHEGIGLAHFYLGDLERAGQHFQACRQRAEEHGDRARLARALGLEGMVAHAAGDIDRAATCYEGAADHARAVRDVHTAAVYRLNQATADYERGRFANAVRGAARARRELAGLGTPAELAAAEYNHGLAALALGDGETAAAAAERASRLADLHDSDQMRVYGAILAGDVERRRGLLDRAAQRYRDARQRAEAAASPRDAAVAERNLAEVMAAMGDRSARELVRRLVDTASGDDDSDRAVLTAARVALQLGDHQDGDPSAGDLAAIAERATRSGRIDLAWRAELTCARTWRRRGDAVASGQAAARARALLDAVRDKNPAFEARSLLGDPDHQALGELESELGAATAPAAPSEPDAQRLRRLLALSRQLNSELREEPLLAQILEAAVDLARAERGALILRPDPREAEDRDPEDRDPEDRDPEDRDPGDGSAHPEPVSRSETEGEGGHRFRPRRWTLPFTYGFADTSAAALSVSRTIAESALAGEVVLTAHAEDDTRWGTSASVASMGLRSVLAVPLHTRQRVVGAIYLDHRFRSGAFDERAVETVRELADIAGVAIGNARLTAALRRREREVEALSRRLAEEIDETRGALDAALVELASRDRRGLRHDYNAIVGDSPAMVEVLRMVDRAAATDLPVVVMGESGTGKELIARALHDNGSRASAAFVAINCGALPEALLESELFGHARGAFTGADRDRRGLFEVADGGTLFLDELADTSLAMQAKLLRVLQEGELRRVGDNRSRRVDVRIIAASNQPLDRLVESGQFREDLFYRLHVLAIRLPPLREREGDIPALCRRLLGEHPIARSALELLCRHTWPGNVRELENELTRATALSDGPITAEHLSERVRRGAATAPPRSGSLEIRPAVEALERELVERALAQTDGNLSRAATLLGLSRYGLQKKLKRWEMR